MFAGSALMLVLPFGIDTDQAYTARTVCLFTHLRQVSPMDSGKRCCVVRIYALHSSIANEGKI